MSTNEHVSPSGQTYTVLLSPPNLTGSLHIGHGLNYVILDSLIRFEKSRGKSVLCAPGTEQPMIRLKYQYEKYVKSASEYPLKSFSDWRDSIDEAIKQQFKTLGVDVDWSLSWTSLDADKVAASQQFFLDLLSKGVIYHSNELCNWCSNCQCVLGEVDLNYEMSQTEKYLLSLKYQEFELSIPMMRLETILHASALGISSNHRDFEKLINNKVELPISAREVPIIALDNSDGMEPDQLRLIVPPMNSIDFLAAGTESTVDSAYYDNGTVRSDLTEYDKQPIDEARKMLKARLEQLSKLQTTDLIKQEVPVCCICGNQFIYPLPKQKYFANLSLAAKEVLAHQSSGTKFSHDIWELGYKIWMSKLVDNKKSDWWDMLTIRRFGGFGSNRDWIVSHESEFGVSLPAFHCQPCKAITYAPIDKVDCCNSCGSQQIENERQVLKGVIQSAISPLGLYSHEGKDTVIDLVVCGHDIYLYWLTLMNQFSQLLYGKTGIGEAVIHGLCADLEGKKMSKSNHNAVTMEEVISRIGAETFRGLVYKALYQNVDIHFLTLDVKDVSEVQANLELFKQVCNQDKSAGGLDGTFIIEELEEKIYQAMSERNLSQAYLDLLDGMKKLHKPKMNISNELKSRLLGLLGLFHPFMANALSSSKNEENSDATIAMA